MLGKTKKCSRARVAEWLTVVCLLHVTWTVVGSSPEPPPMLVGTSASMWIKKLSCHADPHTVSRCHTRSETEDRTSEKACKGSTQALKPMADITRSPKQEYQWPHKKDLCPPNLKKNQKKTKEV